MTISTTTNSVVYRGNGATTAFAVPFKVLDEDHLVVTRRDYTTGDLDYSYVGTDFSYAGLGDSSGTLTLAGAALDDDFELVIQRIVPYTQELDIVNAGGFYPETVEEQLDLNVMGTQQVANLAGRGLAVPVGENGLALPKASDRVGKFLAFGADSAAVAASGTGSDGTLREDLADTGGAALVGVSVGGSVQTSLDGKVDLTDLISFDDTREITGATQLSVDDYGTTIVCDLAADALVNLPPIPASGSAGLVLEPKRTNLKRVKIQAEAASGLAIEGQSALYHFGGERAAFVYRPDLGEWTRLFFDYLPIIAEITSNSALALPSGAFTSIPGVAGTQLSGLDLSGQWFSGGYFLARRNCTIRALGDVWIEPVDGDPEFDMDYGAYVGAASGGDPSDKNFRRLVSFARTGTLNKYQSKSFDRLFRMNEGNKLFFAARPNGTASAVTVDLTSVIQIMEVRTFL